MTSESRPNSKPVFRSLFLAAAFCLSFLAVSCDFFNASLPEFLEEYTRSVAAESYTLDDTYPRNIYGVHCVPSDRPITIYIRLRNPQRYDLDVSETTVEFKDHFASPPILTVSLDPSTKDVVTVQFGPLNSSEEGITVLVNLRLKREDGLKEFEPYTVSLKCNTVPVMPVAVNYDGTVFTVAGSDQWAAFGGNIYWTYENVTTSGGGIYDDVNAFTVNGDKKSRAEWNENSSVTINMADGTISPYTTVYSAAVERSPYSVTVTAVDTDGLVSPALSTGGELYMLDYDFNDGTGAHIPRSSHRPGDMVSVQFISPPPARPGYTFAGWKDSRAKTAADYTDVGTVSFIMPEADVTLYAHWEAVP